MYQTLLLAVFVAFANAKTDLQGCTSSDVIANGGASVLWYMPGTGEVCDFLDCGGGRAPIKTTVPGCPAYEGTATYSPSYLAGFGDAIATQASSTSFVEATTTSPSISLISGSFTASSSASLTTIIPTPDVTLVTGSVSTGSVTPTGSNPTQSLKSQSSGLSASGSQLSGSLSTKTQAPSNTPPSSSGSAASLSDSGNAAVANSINKVSGNIGAFAALFAFLL